jgi:hypothetical protein
LFFQPRPINGSPIEARGRPRLEARHRQVGSAQLIGKAVGGIFPDPTTLLANLSAIENASQERTGAQNDLRCFHGRSIAEIDAHHAFANEAECSDFPCHDLERRKRG